MLRRSIASLCGFCLIAVLALGQAPPQLADKKASGTQSGVAKRVDGHLVRTGVITAPTEILTTFMRPLRCDADGNFYLQTDATNPAIRKINARGERVAVFRPAENPDLKIDAVASFALAPDGRLYELVFPHEIKRYVFIYKPDGTFKEAIKLEPGFSWTTHALAVFPNGQILVAGSEYDRDPMAASWPFTGIFAADGRLLKEIKLDDDDALRDMAASGDPRVISPTVPNANHAVSFTQMETAADGNIYLMRWTNPAIVYALSAGGEVVRRMTIDPGSDGYRPTEIHVWQNRIAVLFFDDQTKDRLMKIVDLQGHEIATYDEVRDNNGKSVNGMLGLGFACYTENPTRFVFLGSSDENRLQLWTAEPR
jgi:hypothetical protein